jgi:peptide/nickel transport system permease protein
VIARLKRDAPTRPLARYATSRLLQGVAVVLTAMVLTFLLAQLGANSAVSLFGQSVSSQRLAAIEHQLGYDRAWPVQLADYMTSAVHGDFGTSIQTGTSAMGVVLGGVPYTLLLALTALLSAVTAALAIAAVAVIKPASRTATCVRALAMGLQGIPEFWLALMLALVFAGQLGWFPAEGSGSPASIVLPAAALAIPLISTLVRLLLSEMVELMRQPFVEALEARGVGRRQIVLRHALRNAMPTLVTFLGLQIGWLLGGTVVVETIFAWPGIGTTLVNSANVHDVPVMQATVVLIAVAFVLFNLAADLLVYRIDPRVRLA